MRKFLSGKLQFLEKERTIGLNPRVKYMTLITTDIKKLTCKLWWHFSPSLLDICIKAPFT